MTKKILSVALVILLCASFAAFAKETKPSKQFPWMVSYNHAGNLNGTAVVGLYGWWGLEASVGAELILGEFNIAEIPLSWGIMARGVVALPLFYSYGGGIWVDWGAAPMVSLHWGVDLGANLKFDIYSGLGLGLFGSTSTYAGWGSPAFGLGIASFSGTAWQISDNFALIAEYGYIGWTSVYGVGATLKL